ncbi:unnamed protein product, partial [Candidula unifasciata]
MTFCMVAYVRIPSLTCEHANYLEFTCHLRKKKQCKRRCDSVMSFYKQHGFRWNDVYSDCLDKC